MYQIRSILFIKVILVLLFHSITPHKHHEELTFLEHELDHENANGIIEYLGIAFHQDLSPNFEYFYLENSSNFNKKDNISFNGPVHLSFIEIKIISFKLNAQSEMGSINPVIEYIELTNGLRAPPRYGFC